MQKKRHSREEVATKLSKADELQERGKTQGEIARALGVSAMTYHRWRKARSQPLDGNGQERVRDLPRSAILPQSAMEELREENAWLRQLVADLSLEKQKLQEMVKALRN